MILFIIKVNCLFVVGTATRLVKEITFSFLVIGLVPVSPSVKVAVPASEVRSNSVLLKLILNLSVDIRGVFDKNVTLMFE